MAVANAGAVTIKMTLDGIEVPDPKTHEDHLVSFVIDRDIGQPDMASIVLYNQDHRYSKLKLAGDVEIKIVEMKDGKTEEISIYKGEIVGLEATFRGGDTQRILIRAMNKFHRLLRIRKSRTFADKTDEAILKEVCNDAGLKLAWKHEKSITYKHVYQHNQNGMEFVRTRAARMGCHLWCVDTTLHCKQPDLSNQSKIELSIHQEVADGPQLRSFTPRISSSPINKKVTVKGWNPETKELITGDHEGSSSPLGGEYCVAASKDHGEHETFTVDHPIWSKEEAAALAKAKHVDQALTFITGEAELVGDPTAELGTTVKITVNTEAKDDTFNGRYYVMGLTHRYLAGGQDNDGGFVTMLRLARDAHKGKD